MMMMRYTAVYLTYLQTKMYNSYMFNDLVILTYKNTIYQSKLDLLAIFETILVCKQHTQFQTDPRARSSLYRKRGGILIDLNQSSPDTNCLHKLLATTFFRENHFSVVFFCFRCIFTHICLSLGETIRFKKSDKIVDTHFKHC